MRYFVGYPQKQHTNLMSMRDALILSGQSWADRKDKTFPNVGLAWLEPTGPWEGQKLGFFKALRHSHWIGLYKEHVFDVNECRWFDIQNWEESVATKWIAACPNATGWKIRSSLEIFG
ncbi:hypothetical protein DDZ13_09650 [Coraliomargarita sinensis]|uniref:Uncharacterized protein n=1 Tax=Coraliomargarita sinensis TaxID=2174842 RepID=A0A317ZEK5_9BACT|nr:hypothetical protein DDZ13_09650 [Coraliomargarita sinensis]